MNTHPAIQIATAAIRDTGLSKGPLVRLSALSVGAKASAPGCLSDRPKVEFEIHPDDRRVRVTVFGFAGLVRPSAWSFLARTCGPDDVAGMGLIHRPTDGNVNAVFDHAVSADLALPEEIVRDLVRRGFQAVGLVGAAILRVNLIDAGFTETYAKRRARQAWRRYGSLLEGIEAWEALATRH